MAGGTIVAGAAMVAGGAMVAGPPPVSWLGPETADRAPEKKKGQAVDAMFCILRLALGEGTGD